MRTVALRLGTVVALGAMAFAGSALAGKHASYAVEIQEIRERVLPPPGERHSLRDDVKDVFTCRPWLVMFVLTLLVFTMLVVRGSSSNYFFAYYLDQPEVMAFLQRLGLGGSAGAATGWSAVLDSLGLLVRPDGSNAAAVGLSLFFVVGSLVQIAGIVASSTRSGSSRRAYLPASTFA